MARLALVPPTRPRVVRRPPAWVHQFMLVVLESEPLIWRRIQVRNAATWWDLHVAIQDAFGWEDRHLHHFDLGPGPRQSRLTVGLPFGDASTTCGWERPLTPDLDAGLRTCLYTYDFGDDWQVAVVHEGRVHPEQPFRWSRCVSGAGAGPLEDSGGIHAYGELLAARHDKAHPMHEEAVAWLPKRFDPLRFSPTDIAETDPRKRLKTVLASMKP
jgi:hypothetical protein